MEMSPSSMLAQISPMDMDSLGHVAQSKPGNVEEVAASFESVFASMLIKEMRNTLSEGLFGGENSDVLGGLFDLHMGQALSEGRGLGIKQLVLEQWQAQPEQEKPEKAR